MTRPIVTLGQTEVHAAPTGTVLGMPPLVVIALLVIGLWALKKSGGVRRW